MASDEPFGSRRSTALALSVAAGLVLLAEAALASCQSAFCHQQRRLRERDREAELKAAVTTDPADTTKWRELMTLLAGKLSRELEIARYDAMHLWEPQPFLEGDAETAVRRERQAWLAAWREAGASPSEAWCAEAELAPDAGARVALLERASLELPDDAGLRRCLVDALHGGGDTQAAVATAEAFRDRHPHDRAAWDLLVTALHRAGDAEGALVATEERARRFPDPELQRQLLAQASRQGRTADRDRLLEQIEGEGGLLARQAACDALDLSNDGAIHAQCHAKLLRDFDAAGALEDDERQAYALVRRAVLDEAVGERDWPTVTRLLDSWQGEQALEAWMRVAGELREQGGCEALLEAVRSGELDAALVDPAQAYDARHLGSTVRDCGDAALGESLLRPWLERAEPHELRWIDEEGARAELARRLARAPADPALLQARADLEQYEPVEAQIPWLEAWAAAAPDAPEPALRLARLHLGRSEVEEAVRWLERAGGGDGDDGVELRLQAGALALGRRDHRAADAAARHVLSGPGSARQHAEARYLLGRIALREGRREEAARELLRYFPLRLRYEGCAGLRTCDHGLLLLLNANGDPALSNYLATRSAAVEWYDEHLQAPERARVPAALAHVYEAKWRAHDGRATEPPPELATGCRAPGTVAYLSNAGVDAAPAGERARRLRRVSRVLPCPAAWPTDLEALFPDAMLLRLGPALAEVR